MVLLLAKQIITLYHAVQKLFAKDQHALGIRRDDVVNALDANGSLLFCPLAQ
nr:hypothetical protein [Alteromonas macleodii]